MIMAVKPKKTDMMMMVIAIIWKRKRENEWEKAYFLDCFLSPSRSVYLRVWRWWRYFMEKKGLCLRRWTGNKM